MLLHDLVIRAAGHLEAFVPVFATIRCKVAGIQNVQQLGRHLGGKIGAFGGKAFPGGKAADKIDAARRKVCVYGFIGLAGLITIATNRQRLAALMGCPDQGFCYFSLGSGPLLVIWGRLSWGIYLRFPCSIGRERPPENKGGGNTQRQIVRILQKKLPDIELTLGRIRSIGCTFSGQSAIIRLLFLLVELGCPKNSRL